MAVMDLLRGFLLHPGSFECIKANKINLFAVFKKYLLAYNSEPAIDKKTILVGFQAFANSFNVQQGSSNLDEYKRKLLAEQNLVYSAIQHYLTHYVDFLLPAASNSISTFLLK